MSYRLDHIALLVRDLDESVAFLTGVLGLAEIPNPMGGTAIRWIEIGDNRRFHVQAGDVSRMHVEKQTHFALAANDFDAVLATALARRHRLLRHERHARRRECPPRRHAGDFPQGSERLLVRDQRSDIAGGGSRCERGFAGECCDAGEVRKRQSGVTG